MFAGTGVWKSKRGTPLLGRCCVFINDEHYDYNVRDELIAADEVSYAYDDIGNRTIAEGKAYTANNLNQYTAIDDFTPQYDADGNQTLIKTETGIWSVTYNAENRPVCWTRGDTIVTMAFDRLGRRVDYQETQDDQVSTHFRFVYDNFLCVQRLNAANGNAVRTEFVWDPTEPIATRPLIMRAKNWGLNLFYTHDGNKNVSEVFYHALQNGIAAHYDYAPFGAVTRTARATRVTNRDLLSENPFRFSSEYHDLTLGLVYYNYRHYNPIIGRWQSLDPLFHLDIRSSSSPEGINLFSFCINNSTLRTDCLGLKCRIIRLIGHFAGKSEQMKGAIWDYYKSADLDECDVVFTISCHMDEFLSESEGVGKPPKNLWPPQEFATGQIAAFAFPYLLAQSEKLIAELNKSASTPPCCCKAYKVETICDEEANRDIEALIERQDRIQVGPRIEKNPCQRIISSYPSK